MWDLSNHLLLEFAIPVSKTTQAPWLDNTGSCMQPCTREISLQGEIALRLVQMSISFFILKLSFTLSEMFFYEMAPQLMPLLLPSFAMESTFVTAWALAVALS